METVAILDTKFQVSIPAVAIKVRIAEMADDLNRDLFGKDVIFLPVLNGAFIFAADLLRQITIPCKVSFIKLASYQGVESTGKVSQLIGLNENIKNKTVVILEDIVDTGNTLSVIMDHLINMQPESIKIAALLHKPASYKGEFPLHYFGFSLPNDFVIGYGLDYNGFGRNYESIYTQSQ